MNVVDAVGDRLADGLGEEVVVPDFEGLMAPGGTRVLEESDQLLLLSVDADDGQPARSEVFAELSDVLELGIAILGRSLAHAGELLVVDP